VAELSMLHVDSVTIEDVQAREYSESDADPDSELAIA
jgi:hypothetical protein